MKKSTTKKVLAGTAVAVALGAVANLLMTTKEGKKIRHEIKKGAAEILKQAKPHLKKLKDVGQADFEKVVAMCVSKYAVAKKLSMEQRRELMKEAKSAWGKVKKHL